MNTHSFDLKFVAFCPKFSWDSYVEFQEKNISREFFRNFVQTKTTHPLPKLAKFRHTFCNFILGLYCVEKIYTSTFICCLDPGKKTGPLINHKKKTWGRKTRTFGFRKTSFVHSQSGTYYSLLLGYFGLKFLSDICHCGHWVLSEIWALTSSHKICNRFFIHHCQGWKNVRLCVKLFDFFPRIILIRLTWNLPCFVPNSVEILTWNFRKKLFHENFSEILCKPRLSSTKTCKILPYFLQFYFGSVLR